MEEKQKKKRRQIGFDVSEELHQKVKIAATLRGQSINLWCTRAIYAALKEQKIDIK